MTMGWVNSFCLHDDLWQHWWWWWDDERKRPPKKDETCSVHARQVRPLSKREHQISPACLTLFFGGCFLLPPAGWTNYLSISGFGSVTHAKGRARTGARPRRPLCHDHDDGDDDTRLSLSGQHAYPLGPSKWHLHDSFVYQKVGQEMKTFFFCISSSSSSSPTWLFVVVVVSLSTTSTFLDRKITKQPSIIP